MTAISNKIDCFFCIYNTSVDTNVGSRSRYAYTPHPATGKTISGWQWDSRRWPNNQELLGFSYIPTLLDSSVKRIDKSLYQSGYGDGVDLSFIGMNPLYSKDRIPIWAPVINHGWYYVYDEEHYLFSDSYQAVPIPAYASSTIIFSSLMGV